MANIKRFVHFTDECMLMSQDKNISGIFWLLMGDERYYMNPKEIILCFGYK